MHIWALNENTCLIELGGDIEAATSQRIADLARQIRHCLGATLIDIVPSYSSVMLSLDLSKLDAITCSKTLLAQLNLSDQTTAPVQTARQIEIPTYYGPEVALDLADIANQTGLSAAAIIDLHSRNTYRIYAIGFAPGFCFLGSLDERLALARKATPRLTVPAGSVAIAQRQTAVYPRATPGGWHILGRTACDMLALCNDPKKPLQVGDGIRFLAIDKAQFVAMGGVFS